MSTEMNIDEKHRKIVWCGQTPRRMTKARFRFSKGWKRCASARVYRFHRTPRLHHLVYEIVDNSIDEALAGFCTDIDVDILPGDVISVRDNGRGIPVGMNEKLGLPTVTVVLTVLHAGGKFGGSGYKVSGGLHGVGSSVVNALSSWMEVEISRDGKIYAQRFERGIPVNDLTVIGNSDHDGTPDSVQGGSGNFSGNY